MLSVDFVCSMGSSIIVIGDFFFGKGKNLLLKPYQNRPIRKFLPTGSS
jgi:hypothetical protein